MKFFAISQAFHPRDRLPRHPSSKAHYARPMVVALIGQRAGDEHDTPTRRINCDKPMTGCFENCQTASPQCAEFCTVVIIFQREPAKLICLRINELAWTRQSVVYSALAIRGIRD